MSLKQALLLALESHRGEDLSGQLLARQLGVSRNAVWKAVNALREEGFDILSGPNKGYRLAPGSDLLSVEGISRYLTGEATGMPVYVHRELDSTNSEAKRLLAAGQTEPALIAAEYQSQGRGRHGRPFYSPRGSGLYMTLILRPNTKLSDAFAITSAAAVAVIRAIEAGAQRRPLIKWVNDIYVDGKKICGILTEAITDFETATAQNVIVGIGLNVSTAEFPADIRETAASLFPAGVTRNQLAGEIASGLVALAQNLASMAHLDEYRAHSMVLGRKILYEAGGQTVRATAMGIDDTGGLVAQRDDGTRVTLSSGEISIIPQ